MASFPVIKGKYELPGIRPSFADSQSKGALGDKSLRQLAIDL